MMIRVVVCIWNDVCIEGFFLNSFIVVVRFIGFFLDVMLLFGLIVKSMVSFRINLFLLIMYF